MAEEEKILFAFVILFITLAFLSCCFTCFIYLATVHHQTNNIYQNRRDTIIRTEGIELKPIIKSGSVKSPVANESVVKAVKTVKSPA